MHRIKMAFHIRSMALDAAVLREVRSYWARYCLTNPDVVVALVPMGRRRGARPIIHHSFNSLTSGTVSGCPDDEPLAGQSSHGGGGA